MASQGWKLFCANLANEWGVAGYGQRMFEAHATLPQGPDRAFELAAITERTLAIKKAVDSLMDWPERELNRLKKPREDKRRFAGLLRV